LILPGIIIVFLMMKPGIFNNHDLTLAITMPKDVNGFNYLIFNIFFIMKINCLGFVVSCIVSMKQPDDSMRTL